MDYDLWNELFRQAYGPDVDTDYPGLDQDIELALANGIAYLQSYVNSGAIWDNGADIVTEYDAQDLEQARWFFAIAWEAEAERMGIESDAWNEQGRNSRGAA